MLHFGREQKKILLILPAFLVFVIFYFYPLGKLLVDSFYSFNPEDLSRVGFAGLENYKKVLASDKFYHAVWNTVKYILCTISVEFFLGFMVALILNRGFRGSGLIRTLFLVPLMLAPIVSGLIWKFMLSSQFGIFNYILFRTGLIKSPDQILWLSDERFAFWACCFAHIWLVTPFFIITLLAGLKGIDPSFYEAATIDGANRSQSFFAITIPALRPVITVALLLKILDAARSFDAIWVLTEGGPASATETLSIFLYKTHMRFHKIGDASAMAFLFIVILLGIAFCFTRQLMPDDGRES